MKPLLAEHDADVGHLIVRKMCEMEEAARMTQRSNSLHGGSVGRALFQGRVAIETGSDSARERAQVLLNHAVQSCSVGAISPTLYEGFTGTAWVAHHLLGDDASELRRAVDAELEKDEVLELVDEAELTNGLAGIGIYALSLGSEGCHLLGRIVDRLCQRAVAGAAGCGWASPRLYDGSPHLGPPSFRMGVAHGQVGILWMLARACGRGIGGALAKSTLKEGLRWLEAQATSGRGRWSFPRVVGNPGDDPRPPRNTWCWGDASAGAALIDIGNVAVSREASALGLRVARATLSRPIGEWRVAGAGLCHGAFGSMHVYHRLYRMTGQMEFRDVAREWFRRGVELLNLDEAGKSWPAWDATDEPGPALMGGGLMDGAAGVGLAVLTALSDVPEEFTWDSVMALSAPSPL